MFISKTSAEAQKKVKMLNNSQVMAPFWPAKLSCHRTSWDQLQEMMTNDEKRWDAALGRSEKLTSSAERYLEDPEAEPATHPLVVFSELLESGILENFPGYQPETGYDIEVYLLDLKMFLIEIFPRIPEYLENKDEIYCSGIVIPVPFLKVDGRDNDFPRFINTMLFAGQKVNEMRTQDWLESPCGIWKIDGVQFINDFICRAATSAFVKIMQDNNMDDDVVLNAIRMAGDQSAPVFGDYRSNVGKQQI